MVRRILVLVEDEPDMRLLVRMELESDPRLEIVGESASAEEAIELAKTSDPGLIILDHQLQGEIMGLEAAPLLKEAAPNARILLFSAFDLAREARLSPYVDRYLSKAKFKDLLPTVDEMLGLPPL